MLSNPQHSKDMGIVTQPFGGARAISWPATDGHLALGTCEFATPLCKEECGLRPNRLQWAQVEWWQNHTPKQIAEQVIYEIEATESTLFHWFSSGDCPRAETDKAHIVATYIAQTGIPQNGFTRNKLFWRRCLDVPLCHIALTVEDRQIAERRAKEGPVSVPRYKEDRTEIIGPYDEKMLCGGGFVTPLCGAGVVEEEDEIYIEDCGECLRRGGGCFTHLLGNSVDFTDGRT